MSVSMQKMWISIIGMFLLALAMLAIYVSRYKVKNKWFKSITAIVAWICLMVGGLIMLFIVLSGPTN
ncbi:DUF2768 domain-containing protein [Lederbergia sp. NSJ-179]|uniref:DUF2768 domain-containing protein n=1 Tax=Lederbergia sp. NSJ-179 TaxID=2931402 RepID=UPI001FD57C42|nr:DUF2768 domain-containing protein [Lederbergia sp. NSJ-179]MCJ7839452.1 DUF2768 domain-containing protein [Lederbergia sp. NSJ-179]